MLNAFLLISFFLIFRLDLQRELLWDTYLALNYFPGNTLEAKF